MAMMFVMLVIFGKESLHLWKIVKRTVLAVVTILLMVAYIDIKLWFKNAPNNFAVNKFNSTQIVSMR